MRNMSFALTTKQILNQTKTVTRRDGWRFLKPGDLIQAVEKGMGLKKGEKVKKLAVLKVVSVRQEPLNEIHKVSNYWREELDKEGFPHFEYPYQFTDMFIKSHKGVRDTTPITRIEFEYVDKGEA